jgi:hypothetical protein
MSPAIDVLLWALPIVALLAIVVIRSIRFRGNIVATKGTLQVVVVVLGVWVFGLLLTHVWLK